jgi:hypothetical protein
VSPDPGVARRAALEGSRLDPDRFDLDIVGRGQVGSRARVTVRYASPTALPLVGALVGDVHLSATATMRVEV